MPVTVKPYECLICGVTEQKYFASGRKSCCQQCLKETTSKERRQLVLLPYECRECGDIDQLNFYKYCKNKCRKHFNSKLHYVKNPEIVIIRVNDAVETRHNIHLTQN